MGSAALNTSYALRRVAADRGNPGSHDDPLTTAGVNGAKQPGERGYLKHRVQRR